MTNRLADSLTLELCSPATLNAETIHRWKFLQRNNPNCSTPYLRPEWVQMLDVVLGRVEVAILRRDDAIVGFFPFERVEPQAAGPVGGPLNDGDGIVLDSEVEVNLRHLLQFCNIRTWTFGHCAENTPAVLPYVTRARESAHINLSRGFETYRESREKCGTAVFKTSDRKSRKLSREIGEVQFELASMDEDVVDKLVKWKSVHLQRAGLEDAFQAAPWIASLLKQLNVYQSVEFSSMLSTLRVRNHLVAAHWGLRCGELFVSGVPAYDPEYGAYSPGLILTTRMIEQAAATGVTDLELGLGLNQMKMSMMTHTMPLVAGVVDASSARHLARVTRRCTGDILSRLYRA